MKPLREALISKNKRDWAEVNNSKYLNSNYIFLYIPSDSDKASNLLGEDDGLFSIWPYWFLNLFMLKETIKKIKNFDPKDAFYAVKLEEYNKREIEEFDKIINEFRPDSPQDKLGNWPRIPNEDIMKLKK